MPFAAGTKLGAYEIQSLLGAGGGVRDYLAGESSLDCRLSEFVDRWIRYRSAAGE